MTDAATHGGGWVQIVFHHLCEGCDAYSITPEDFEGLLAWLETQAGNAVSVQTTHQVIGGQVLPPVAP